jgi:3-phenylpropionate/cinnamic acid dioxygenase small subunit
MSAIAAPLDATLVAEVGAFLAHEAALLDRRRWHDWLDLFAPEALYWAPAWNGDDEMTTDPSRQLSLIYADRNELEARIFRIESDDSYASMPLPHTVHIVACTGARRAGQGTIAAEANWLVHAFWRTSGPVLRAGRYEYELEQRPDALKIKRKKVFIHDDRVIGAIDLYNI